MKIWQPSEQWHRKHSQSRVYRVDIEAPQLNDATWTKLTSEHELLDGKIALGGVSIERIEPHVVSCVSGGEDAFDSLDYAINEVLLEALPSLEGVRVVLEERAKR